MLELFLFLFCAVIIQTKGPRWKPLLKCKCIRGKLLEKVWMLAPTTLKSEGAEVPLLASLLTWSLYYNLNLYISLFSFLFVHSLICCKQKSFNNFEIYAVFTVGWQGERKGISKLLDISFYYKQEKVLLLSVPMGYALHFSKEEKEIY